MIKIKDIVWVHSGSSNYWMAFVRDFMFLQLHQSMVDEGNWYIHTTSVLFRVAGNEGIKKWGWMSLEEAKIKSEDIITKELLSFIDIRDYNLNKLI
jgi:hypothetical protein